nr:ATP-binding cassette domain-containing protein [Mammaliicoccus sp. Marseille-Q6498]
MSKYAIEAKNLTKSFNKNKIIENLSFKIPELSTVHIIGSNGSGKSVLLKLIANLYALDSGEITSNAQNISYSPDHFPEDINVTIHTFLQTIYSINKNKIDLDKYNQFVENFNLKPFLNYKIKNCSKGTQQKINIIQALLSDNEILLFDEPINGLDKESQEYFLNHLHTLKNHKTIIFTSHEKDIMKEIATHNLDLEAGLSKNMIEENTYYLIKFHSDEKLNLNYDVEISDGVYSIKVLEEAVNEVLLKLIESNCNILEVRSLRDGSLL